MKRILILTVILWTVSISASAQMMAAPGDMQYKDLDNRVFTHVGGSFNKEELNGFVSVGYTHVPKNFGYTILTTTVIHQGFVSLGGGLTYSKYHENPDNLNKEYFFQVTAGPTVDVTYESPSYTPDGKLKAGIRDQQKNVFARSLGGMANFTFSTTKDEHNIATEGYIYASKKFGINYWAHVTYEFNDWFKPSLYYDNVLGLMGGIAIPVKELSIFVGGGPHGLRIAFSTNHYWSK